MGPSEGCGPGVWAPVRAGFRAEATETMSQSNDAGHKTRHDGSASTFEHETIGACPDCGTAETNVYPRRDKQCVAARSRDPDAAFVCHDCGATFDELEERERGPGGGRKDGTLAKALVDADPDAVGGGA